MRSTVQSLPHPIANLLLMLRRAPGALFEDGLLTITNSDFRKCPRFREAYAAAKATGSFSRWHLRWRIHVLCWAAKNAARVDGDFVECGTDHGGTAMAAITYADLAETGKAFWLLDTFRGLDAAQSSDRFLDYADCWQRVQATFSGMDFVRLVRGRVPDTLAQVTAERVAFLHIDMNAPEPEVAALEWFWPKISGGGLVVLDDYGWPRHIEQKRAIDAWAAGSGVGILQLPTGQGIILKPGIY